MDVCPKIAELLEEKGIEAKYSPFEGWQVKGLPVMTFVNGKLAMDDGEIVAKGGTGRIIQGGD